MRRHLTTHSTGAEISPPFRGEDEGFPLDAHESVDTDGDGIGNNADADDDNDGQRDADEAACGSNPLDAASKSPDNDADNSPDCVDPDDDNDGVADTSDNCPRSYNPDQKDTDRDGVGDACDADGVYRVCVLYDQNKAVRSGSTFPVKLQPCDALGHNLSSPGTVVTAVGVMKVSASGPMEDSGRANPDYNFRYDATLGGSGGGYVFNLSTRGLTTGTYLLGLKVGSDPYTYSVRFQVR